MMMKEKTMNNKFIMNSPIILYLKTADVLENSEKEIVYNPIYLMEISKAKYGVNLV